MLHYFLLVAFAWMLIEGIFLHILIVKVFHDHLPKKRSYVTFCWGKSHLRRTCCVLLFTIKNVSLFQVYHSSLFCCLSACYEMDMEPKQGMFVLLFKYFFCAYISFLEFIFTSLFVFCLYSIVFLLIVIEIFLYF